MSLSDMPKEKQKLVMIGLVAVIVIVGGYFAYSTFFAGSGGGAADMPPSANANYGQPGGPGMPSPGAPGATGMPGPGAPAPGQAPAPAGNPPAQAPTPSPSAPPAAAPPSAPPAQPAAVPKPGAAKPATKSITVFESITVNYPSGWGIALGSAGSAAVLSDGKARFELRAPDPKASTAKAIADSAQASVAKNSKVISQGPLKIAGFDAYQITVNGPSGPTRIVGVDSPTRIAVVEYVKGGQMSSYRATFDKMESDLQFR